MKLARFLAPLAGTVLLASTAAFAGVNSWTLTGPFGGPASTVVAHPDHPEILFAALGNGLYRSTDAGANWTWHADLLNARDIVFDPADHQRLFAVRGEGRVWRSTDGGINWAILDVNNETPGRLSIANDGTLYVLGKRGQVFKSINAGTSFTTSTTPWTKADDVGQAIAVDPSNANIVLVGVQSAGIYRSSDGGATWTAGPTPNSPGSQNGATFVHDIAFRPGLTSTVVASGTYGIQVSGDGGASWSALLGYGAQALAFDPAQTNVVVGVGNGSIVRSVDGGATWATGVALASSQTIDIAFGGNHRVLVAAADGPVISEDGGVTFALRTSGIQAQSLRRFARTPGGAAYLAFLPGPYGVFQLDGGAWSPVNNAALRDPNVFTGDVFTVAVAPSLPSRVYVVETGDAFRTSGDSGQTWTAPTPQLQGSHLSILEVVVDPQDPKVVYITTQTMGVWRSENYGLSFVNRSTGLTPTSVRALAIDPTNPAVLYAGGWFSGTNGIYKSTDSGLSWTRVGVSTLGTAAVEAIVIDPADSQKLWAVLQLGLSRSIDGGSTWTPVLPVNDGSFLVRSVQFDSEYPGMVILGGGGTAGFARSVDDGAHWQFTSGQLVHPTLGGLDLMMFSRPFGMIYSGGYATGLHVYQIATNLEVTATSASPIALGASGSFDVTVSNLGPFDAVAPRLDVRPPANVTVTGSTVPAGCQWVAPVYRCVLANLRWGQSRALTFAYTAATAESASAIQANVFAREYDPVYANDVALLAVSTRALTDLAVTSSVTAAVQTAASVAFNATVKNNGPNDSATTRYTLTAPEGVSLQSSSTSAGVCVVSTTGVTCELGALANGASATITVAGTASTAGTKSWASAVTGGGEDPVATNNAITASTTVTAPAASPPASGGGKSGGGGRFEWLTLLALGGVLLGRRRPTAAR